MKAGNAVLMATAVALCASMSVAHAEYHDYRYEHRNGREMHRDYRHERYERERYEARYRHHYIVERPVYVEPRVVYSQPMPSSINIVLPIQLP